ncbi:hypothetical protein [Streptomyces sp. NPDC010273]|uniref:hypothetical protein n=1 Tax=Streptomyces sp. NPDC010273 TaxID=3364829 RepID=UPI0036E30FFC
MWTSSFAEVQRSTAGPLRWNSSSALATSIHQQFPGARYNVRRRSTTAVSPSSNTLLVTVMETVFW